MSFEKEFDDVLLELGKRRRKEFSKQNIKRMKLTDDWAKVYGKRKKPKWSNQMTSYHDSIIKVVRGYFSYFGFATKIKKKRTKQGTKYTLQIYDTVARRLR